jgi:membrane protein required for colicin V production
MSLTIVDILFVVTVILLVFNGLNNGALFSLVSLLALPIGFAVAYYLGPGFILLLASSGLPATPLIAYAVLFIGTILVLHVLANFLRGVVKWLPLFGALDKLLGGVIGFVEAWLIWLILLTVLGTFLNDIQAGTSAFPGIDITQFITHYKDWHVQSWYTFYNDAVNHSLFTKANNFFGKIIPIIKQPPQLAK